MRLLLQIITTLTPLLASPGSAFIHWRPFARNPDTVPDPVKRNPTTQQATYPPPTWDNSSLFLLGQRAMLFSAEFHPFRLPVPSLWFDVLEKMKAAGLTTVSFHAPWALLEGKPGEFRAEGVFDLTEFFRGARESGLWVVARPGPYIRRFSSTCVCREAVGSGNGVVDADWRAAFRFSGDGRWVAGLDSTD